MNSTQVFKLNLKLFRKISSNRRQTRKNIEVVVELGKKLAKFEIKNLNSFYKIKSVLNLKSKA